LGEGGNTSSSLTRPAWIIANCASSQLKVILHATRPACSRERSLGGRAFERCRTGKTPSTLAGNLNVRTPNSVLIRKLIAFMNAVVELAQNRGGFCLCE
jgi:hypothetical protein